MVFNGNSEKIGYFIHTLFFYTYNFMGDIMSNYVSSRKLRKSYRGDSIENSNNKENNSLGIRMLLSSFLILGAFVMKQYYFEELSSNKKFMEVYNILKQENKIESILDVNKVDK